jgi:pyruvate dehydrogenase E2 component (dihydrolipoamide acetyltransferase)
MVTMEIEVPELGEHVDEAEVLSVLVSEGDRVEENQPILELQTDKASMEMPSPTSGKVRAIHVSEGDTVTPGQVILELDTESAEEGTKSDQGSPTPKRKEGPEEARGDRGTREERAEEPQNKAQEAKAEDKGPETKTRLAPQEPKTGREPPVPAGPATRRFAREAGVDLRLVAEQVEGKRVTRKDVEAFLAKRGEGEEAHREPLSRVRLQTARRLAESWPEIPLVTQHDEADVTELEQARRKVRERAPDLPLTVTSVVAKAVTVTLHEFPRFNASLDYEQGEFLIHGNIDLGIAVDTEHGLLVPVVRNAGHKTTREIAHEIARLAESARNRKLSADELSGSTFSITNLGGIGGTSFTPLVNPPEVAILGLSRVRSRPVWRSDGPPIERLFLPLSLSYDHRAIDGAAAARFTRKLASLLESPLSLVLDL